MANRTNVLLTFVRHRHSSKHWLKDGVRYGKVTYYQKDKSLVDPPITPSKVLMVHRVKPIKGNPWWEKNILERLGFEEKVKQPVFVKNTPEMCKALWVVKHLVKIVPVQLPEKLPEVNDLTNIYFHDDGSVHSYGKLDYVRYEATMKHKMSMKRLSNYTISEKLRLRWMQGNLV
ncbi:39S ribosomal protein L30, mitochondrial [Colletes gigas]|uniref:39S ribosomal protein L30, mitochondrial n=1 Tax=Colletes gigas TaxID=935657 RepID=UPI001C9AB876|nr:39S ribosomal protein L30, mitochondrial [Colletes gigas]